MTKKSPVRLLLNAESFGFGPSAAIASFFPHLREKFDHIAYVGTGHSLDLQRSLPYDVIYDLSDPRTAERFDDIVSDYDLFFTALDSERAQAARDAGIPTIVYDPLTWYWPTLPEVLKDDVLYIAQDFHGVRERLEKEKDKISEAKVVSPIIPEESSKRTPEFVLVNLGGLQNPYWTTETATEYAHVIIDSLKKAIPESEKLVIVTSEKIASGLKDTGIKTYTRDQMLELLPRVKYAVMTSGLGNIYDVAGYDIPTVFLPPANDSQALQLFAMKREGTLDAAIDWVDILPEGQAIDYSARQPEILQRIAGAVHKMQDDPQLQKRFADACKDAIAQVEHKEHSATAKLAERFGRGGAKQVADIVTAYAAKLRPKHSEKIVTRREHTELGHEGRV